MPVRPLTDANEALTTTISSAASPVLESIYFYLVTKDGEYWPLKTLPPTYCHACHQNGISMHISIPSYLYFRLLSVPEGLILPIRQVIKGMTNISSPAAMQRIETTFEHASQWGHSGVWLH